MANVTGPQFSSVPGCKEREKSPGTGLAASDQETGTAPKSSPHSPNENVKPVKPPPMLSPKFVEGYVVGDTSWPAYSMQPYPSPVIAAGA